MMWSKLDIVISFNRFLYKLNNSVITESAVGTISNGRNMTKVLVIEDNVDTQLLLNRTLVPTYEVKMASDLKSALSKSK